MSKTHPPPKFAALSPPPLRTRVTRGGRGRVPPSAGASRLQRCRLFSLFSLETVATAGAQIPGTLHQAAASRDRIGERGGGVPCPRPPPWVWVYLWVQIWGVLAGCHFNPPSLCGCPPNYRFITHCPHPWGAPPYPHRPPRGALLGPPPKCGGSAPGLGAPPSSTLVPNWIHLEGPGWEGKGGAPKSLMGKAEGWIYGVRGDVVAELGGGSAPRPSPSPSAMGIGGFPSFQPPQTPTHHHQECRKPGGSPSVMFFSHRICRKGRGGSGQQPPQGWGSRTPPGWDGGVWGCCPPPLTSDKKVWADFWAPTCSRYS